MKKLITSLALVTFLFSAAVNAQEVKKERKSKKAKTEKAACSTEEKKACSTDKKVSCCAAKKA
ncbi:MAG: hypothetical protein V4670_01135 [Bacteroidota bacterium]